MRSLLAVFSPFLFLSPLAAHAQVLQGGVQQNQTLDTSTYHLQQLLVDMYHTLSILVAPNQAAEDQFNNDVAEFNAIKARGIQLAVQYSPCVDDFKQSYPHMLQAAKLRQSNAPASEINQEAQLAGQFLSAGANCQDDVDRKNYQAAADQATNPPAQNGGGSNPGYPQQPANGYPGAPASGPQNPPVRGGVSGGGSQGQGPGSEGANGGLPSRGVPCPGGRWVSHDVMLAGRGPRNMRCRLDMATNDFVCCPGNFWTGYEGPIPTPAQIANPNGGGYNPCANPTPPPECPPRSFRRSPPPNPRPSSNPIRDAAQYIQGLMQGLGDCAKAGQDLLAAAASMGRGDFVTAARVLGLKPGQSVFLRGVVQEALARNIGISPYQAGRLAGRRICLYGIVPGVLKGATDLRGVSTPGATPYNPLRGAAIATQSGELAGKWIQGPTGTIQLGPLRGSGAFGSVYGLQQGRVIKISNAGPNSAASFPRQVSGTKALQSAGVPVPSIYGGQFSPSGQPSFLIMDDIAYRWPQSQIVSDIQALSPQQISAIRSLYTKIADNGLIWADGHSSNIFFTPGPNGLAAGVVDSDMVFNAPELGAQDAIVQNTVGNVLWQSGQQGLLFSGFNPGAVMNALFNARFQ